MSKLVKFAMLGSSAGILTYEYARIKKLRDAENLPSTGNENTEHLMLRPSPNEEILIMSAATVAGVTMIGLYLYYEKKYGGGKTFIEITPEIKRVADMSKWSGANLRLVQDGYDYVINVLPQVVDKGREFDNAR